MEDCGREDGLRMRHLIEWLVFGTTISHRRTLIRIVWCRHAGALIPRGWRHKGLPAVYERMFDRFEVVVDEIHTVTCKRGGPRVLSEEERLWDELRLLYPGGCGEEKEYSFEEVDIGDST